MAHLGSYLWFSEAVHQFVSSISFETTHSFDRMGHDFLHQNLSIKKLTEESLGQALRLAGPISPNMPSLFDTT